MSDDWRIDGSRGYPALKLASEQTPLREGDTITIADDQVIEDAHLH